MGSTDGGEIQKELILFQKDRIVFLKEKHTQIVEFKRMQAKIDASMELLVK